MADKLPESSKKLFDYIRSHVNVISNPREIDSIAYMILEDLYQLDKTDVIMDRSISGKPEKEKKVRSYIDRLNNYEPIQYILGYANFYGRKIMVSPQVLIPRSETEELVELILEENQVKRFRLLDIGTGSGCIPVTIMKERQGVKCYGIDIDPRSIKVARQNAEMHKVEVEYLLLDILEEKLPVNQLDVIVSNPPYIPESERGYMEKNVVDYEPHKALFVPDEDPLIFYRAILNAAQNSLKRGGKVYFEVHENLAEKVQSLLIAKEYRDIDVLIDLHGKKRMVRGVKNQ